MLSELEAARIFRAAQGKEGTAPGPTEGEMAVGLALLAQLRAAQTAWPTLHLAPERFLSYLGERSRDQERLEDANAVDLYLACACAAGEGEALRLFESTFIPEAERVLARFRLDPQAQDELKQALRQRLLMSQEGQPPRIAQYSGRGELRRWVQACVSRLALNDLRGRARDQPPEEELMAVLYSMNATLPEVRHLREEIKEAFEPAFRETIAQLPAKQRLVLQQYFLDGLTVKEMGALHRVHFTTAFRWIEKAREALAAGVKGRLATRLQLGPAELESATRVLHTHLDLTFSALMTAENEPTG